jgi:anti-sigma-K factor RskA
MTPENDTHPHDELAIYALDALDPDEHAAIEAHLARCAACRAELEEHRDTLSRLVVPDEAPPPSVWEGIAQQLPRLGGAPDASGPPALPPPAPGDTSDPPDGGEVVPLHFRRQGRGFVERSGWLAAAAALIAVVGIGAFVAGRSGDSGGGTASVTDLAAAAADDTGAEVVALQNDSGDAVARVVLTGDATDYVIFDDLAELPAERSYQLWTTDPSGEAPPVSLGVLGDGATGAVAIAAPDGVTDLAITDEPAGGVPAPTGPVVASGQIA